MWVGLPVNGCIIVRAIGGSFADRREKLHQIGLVEEKEAGDQAGLKKPGSTKRCNAVQDNSAELGDRSLLRNVANIIFNRMEQTDAW